MISDEMSMVVAPSQKEYQSFMTNSEISFDLSDDTVSVASTTKQDAKNNWNVLYSFPRPWWEDGAANCSKRIPIINISIFYFSINNFINKFHPNIPNIHPPLHGW